MPSLSYPSSSTSDAVKDVLSVATLAANSPFALQVASDIQKESNWRWQYHHHAVRHVRACAEASREQCLQVAKAGLDRIYNTFRYGDRDDTTLAEALRKHRTDPKNNLSDCHFTTGNSLNLKKENKFENNPSISSITLPFGGKLLRGEEVNRKALQWATKGVIEPDAAEAICNLKESDLNLSNSNDVFVVMGAGAAMGPLDTLLSLGATVVALDLPIPAIWERLFDKTKSSRGSIIFPMIRKGGKDDAIDLNDEKEMASRAGCNFLTQISEIIDWLVLQCPKKRLVIGQYAYLDSAAFVKVSLAMDAVASECLRQRPDSALAYLCTPTDVFAIPPAARDASARQYESTINQYGSKILQFISGNHMLQQNVVPESRAGSKIPIVDALVLQQGPNYFFAKRLQHWRAMLVHSGEGGVVSSNVAPASYTQSVLKNKLLAAAFAGAQSAALKGAAYISTVEIFDPETSNVFMTYLLLHDLKQRRTFSEQRLRPDLSDHPLSLFAATPVHNGIWRCGFQIRSLLEIVIAHYVADNYRNQLFAATALCGGTALILRSRL